MFSPNDFELPLEKQLRMRVIEQEIMECSDVNILRERLKDCAITLMKYQHLLTVTLQKQIEENLMTLASKIEKEALSNQNGNTGTE